MSFTEQSYLYKAASIFGLYKRPKWRALIGIIVYTVISVLSLYSRFKTTYRFTINITDAILDGVDYSVLSAANISSLISLGVVHSGRLQRLHTRISLLDTKLGVCRNKDGIRIGLFAIHLVVSIIYYWTYWGLAAGTVNIWPYNFYKWQLVQVFVAAMIVYSTAGMLLERFKQLNASRNVLTSMVINDLHKRLLLDCVEFNKIFGVPCVFLTGSLFIGLLHCINSVLLQIMRGNVFSGWFQLPDFALHYLLISGFMINNSMILCIPLAMRCNQIELEAKRTARILKQFNAHTKLNLLTNLTLAGTKNYPQFTAARLFSVNRTMLVAILAGVGSHVIILVQFNLAI